MAEGIGDGVVFPGHVLNIGGIFGNGGQMPALAGALRIRGLLDGKGQRLVICEDRETAALEEKTKMANCKVYGQELSVERAVLRFRRPESAGEKGEWFSFSFHV